MTQIVLNVEDNRLLPSLQQILGAIKGVTIDRLTPKVTETKKEKKFIGDTIKTGFTEAREGRYVGKNLTSLDNLVDELRAEAV